MCILYVMYMVIFRCTTREETFCFPPTVREKPGWNWRLMRNLRIDICYDGTRYRGWQRLVQQENTIQGKIEQALTRILGETIEITGSGRTDAGVHARGQVANFHCSSSMDCSEILSALRSYLPEDIGIYSCREVSERFHARYLAKSKTYCYRLWNSDLPCVFERRYLYVDCRPLDLAAMQRGASHFLGEHDFSAFCTNRNDKKSAVRRIDSFAVTKIGHEIRFTVKGDGFLYNMVRIMVGTLLEVGSGERQPDEIPALFGQKREKTGGLVPAKGLCLMEVSY